MGWLSLANKSGAENEAEEEFGKMRSLAMCLLFREQVHFRKFPFNADWIKHFNLIADKSF